jgi:2'-5' RNA ligase
MRCTLSVENVGVEALLAVDVAILPPRRIADTAIAWSAGLPELESQGLRLDHDTHLPHITLTQLFVARQALPQLIAAVQSVVVSRALPPLRITGAGRGSQSVWMQIGRTPALDELHQALMDVLLPFERRGGNASAFADGDVRPSDVRWVSGFRGSASYERFTPHITLGHASRLPHVEPMTFDAEVVALCHLGRFCACRTILESWTLGSR